MQKIELYVIGATVAIALGFTAAFSMGPGGFTMTAEGAATAAQESAAAAHDGARLIVVELGGCGWCARLRKEIAPEYVKSTYHTEVAPLSYMNLDRSLQRKVKLKAAVNRTPTLLMVDREGNELGRMVGYPGTLRQMIGFVGRYAG